MNKHGRIQDETIKRLRSRAGIDIHVCPKKDFTKKFALYVTPYGSIDNDFTSATDGRRRRMPAGIAHFLEHKMFEKDSGDLTDRFAALGATTNAMTSFETTGYYIECADRFEESLAVLSELVMRPWFTPALVEKEKGIIAQEIKMYQDDPSWRGSMAVLKNLFGRHPVAADIAGTVESIKEIGADDLATCHRTFYAPSNLMLIVVGDVDARAVVRIADDAAQRFAPDDRPAAIDRHYNAAPVRVRRRTSEKWPMKTPKFFAGWRVDARGKSGPELLDLETLLDLAIASLFARSGVLHRRLFERGLIDDSFSVSSSVEKEFAYAAFSSDTPDPAALEKELLLGIDEALKAGPSEEEFDRARKMMFGRFIRGFNSPENTAWNIAECRLKDVDFLEWGSRLTALSNREARAAVKKALDPRAFTSHVILPE